MGGSALYRIETGVTESVHRLSAEAIAKALNCEVEDISASTVATTLLTGATTALGTAIKVLLGPVGLIIAGLTLLGVAGAALIKLLLPIRPIHIESQLQIDDSSNTLPTAKCREAFVKNHSGRFLVLFFHLKNQALNLFFHYLFLLNLPAIIRIGVDYSAGFPNHNSQSPQSAQVVDLLELGWDFGALCLKNSISKSKKEWSDGFIADLSKSGCSQKAEQQIFV